MSQTKFTPGPWTLHQEDLRGGCFWSVRIPEPDAEPVDLHESDNGEANARLIAAAPDLYEALAGEQGRLVEELEDICADVQEGGSFSQHSERWKQINAALSALSKARGES